MSKRYKAMRRRNRVFNCDECGKPGARACFLPEPPRSRFTQLSKHGRKPGEREAGWITVEREPDERLCGDCAAKGGYCRCCGDFWAGTSSFDFIHPGLCDHCYDEDQLEDQWEKDDWINQEVPW